jgi:hypothetical protein
MPMSPLIADQSLLFANCFRQQPGSVPDVGIVDLLDVLRIDVLEWPLSSLAFLIVSIGMNRIAR